MQKIHIQENFNITNKIKVLLTNISKSNTFFGSNHRYQPEVYLSHVFLPLQLRACVYH